MSLFDNEPDQLLDRPIHSSKGPLHAMAVGAPLAERMRPRKSG